MWYFGSRKVEIDGYNRLETLSKRKLLRFFSADTNKAQWPGCNDAYRTLYRGFDTNAFYGKDHEKMNSQQKENMVRDRFSSVLAAGLPEAYNQSSEKQISEDENEHDEE
ncbi:hypothetical protein F7734_09385 [Scytonema sp. UIC 10036]|uniref:hypothetical protein n=1 Tax=Scytonema sp. UIC 10036 TaxID=2304196 RepID=UPI0012DA5132|nr:hypothetical protein [Scytonema sp. UIC 10036]MUG92654.1 hypothetical protein [Scytonema sp. UIC 10036]